MSDRPGLFLSEPNKLTFPILTLLKTAKPKPTPKGQASNEEVFSLAARLMVQKATERLPLAILRRRSA